MILAIAGVRLIKMKKRGSEFSFTWIFVLIVGAAILALALFLATRLIEREGEIYNTQVAAELGALLSPLETSIEAGKYYPLTFPETVRISNECTPLGTFGEQEISLSVRSGIGKEWHPNGLPYRFSNKYVFSEPLMEAAQVHLIATPVVLPYKVGDALVFYTKTYCLVDAPETVIDEVNLLGPEGIIVAESRSLCPRDSISVCFTGSGCAIHVDLISTSMNGEVIKDRTRLPFNQGLFYAALVSDPDVYSCQLERLRKRAYELASLYAEKSSLMNGRGCLNTLAPSLSGYQTQLIDSGESFLSIVRSAEVLDTTNERLVCRLF